MNPIQVQSPDCAALRLRSAESGVRTESARSGVAQIFNLLYRRFSICRAATESPRREPFPAAAECNSALQQSATLRYELAPWTTSTHEAPRVPFNTCNSFTSAFTLIELLVVLAIIAILAALALPVLQNFKPNYAASATRQFLDDLARARQLAISQRTTVYMIFVPTNFWTHPAFTANSAWFNAKPSRCTNLLDKQTIGYTFVSLHTLGDQPGRPTVQYLSGWRTLPAGAFIDPMKFTPPGNNQLPFTIYTNDPVTLLPTKPAFTFVPFPYSVNNNVGLNIPFPSEDTLSPPYNAPPSAKYVPVPYIAFDYMGRLVSQNPTYPNYDEIIPLCKGNVVFTRGPDRRPLEAGPSFSEQPPGNGTNATTYNVVYIDRTTGRARAIQQEVK